MKKTRAYLIAKIFSASFLMVLIVCISVGMPWAAYGFSIEQNLPQEENIQEEDFQEENEENIQEEHTPKEAQNPEEAGLPFEPSEAGEPPPLEKEPEEENSEGDFSEDIVFSEEELFAWCEAHKDTGGTVFLGDTVKITDYFQIGNYPNKIIIDTGSWGLIYDGGYIYMDSFEIIGEGVDVPVLDIYDVGGDLNWIHAVQSQTLTATGRSGVGGTALRVSKNDAYAVDFLYIRDEGFIYAQGEGAIGVYLSVNMNVYCLNIKTEGKNSVALYAEKGADLYYCKLNAEGPGAETVSGSGSILLDTCAAEPQVNKGEIVNYSITKLIGRRFYFPVAQYSDDLGYNYYSNVYTFLMERGEEYPYALEKFYLQTPEPEEINTNELGTFSMEAGLYPPFQGLGIEDKYPLEMIFDVRDPSLPCISQLAFHKNNNRLYARLSFWQSYNPHDGNIILWRSDDGGEHFYDYTDSPDIEWAGNDLFFYYDKIQDTIQFQIEVPEVGVSNTVTLYATDRVVATQEGGDRTGTDRILIDREKDEEDKAPGHGDGGEDEEDKEPGYGGGGEDEEDEDPGYSDDGEENEEPGYAGNEENEDKEPNDNIAKDRERDDKVKEDKTADKEQNISLGVYEQDILKLDQEELKTDSNPNQNLDKSINALEEEIIESVHNNSVHTETHEANKEVQRSKSVKINKEKVQDDNTAVKSTLPDIQEKRELPLSEKEDAGKEDRAQIPDNKELALSSEERESALRPKSIHSPKPVNAKAGIMLFSFFSFICIAGFLWASFKRRA